MSAPKVTKLPSGSYRARAYDYTDENGKRHYKSFTAQSKNEALLLALAHEPQKPVAATYNDLTLKQAAERFIETREKTLSASTVREYERIKNKDFAELMQMRIGDITAEIVQTAVNEVSGKLSPKTVRNRYGFIHDVLVTYAPSLTLNSVHLPQKIKPKYYVPTTAEVEAVLNAANDCVRVPILLASRGSLRRSEICALTIDDISDIGATINKAVVRNKNGEYVVKTTKTKAGDRICPLPPDVIAAARKWQHFGINPEKLSREWGKAKRIAGVDFRFHDLRHFWASLLHAKGVPDKYIALYGGWESVAMLHEIYAHALRDKQPEMKKQIIDIFSNEFPS